MPASTRSNTSKTCSGLTRDTMPSKKTQKRQLSNPEEAKQLTKKDKKKHDDNGNDDDNDNEGKEVADDGKGPKWAKRAAKIAKCVSAAFYIYIDSNVLYR